MRRLVVLGGSGASTPELAEALLRWPGDSKRRPPLEVVLHGRSIDKLEVVGRAFTAVVERAEPAIAVRTTGDLERALDGADVILNQVRVGGYRARVFDETFPRAFGIPGEETMGPGGFANALRTVPALRPAWEAVARTVRPGSLVINLTNPAGIVVAAAAREFAIPIVEVCDSPISFLSRVADRLGRSMAGVVGGYLGGNHFGWWRPASPLELETVASLGVGVTVDDVMALGALPAPYDRYYLAPGPLLEAQRAGPSRGEQLIELERELLEGYARGTAPASSTTAGPAGQRPASRPTPSEPVRRGAVWYGLAVVPLLDAWWHGADDPLVVGRPPDGSGRAWTGSAGKAVFESAVRLDAGEFTSGPRVDLPSRPLRWLEAHAGYEAMTVDALTGGAARGSLVAALAANPMVRDEEQASALVGAILDGSPGG